MPAGRGEHTFAAAVNPWPRRCGGGTLAVREVCSISSNSSRGLLCGVAIEAAHSRACSLRPRRKSHRGDSATNKLPTRNRMPGGIDIQKIRRHA